MKVRIKTNSRKIYYSAVCMLSLVSRSFDEELVVDDDEEEALLLLLLVFVLFVVVVVVLALG